MAHRPLLSPFPTFQVKGSLQVSSLPSLVGSIGARPELDTQHERMNTQRKQNIRLPVCLFNIHVLYVFLP